MEQTLMGRGPASIRSLNDGSLGVEQHGARFSEPRFCCRTLPDCNERRLYDHDRRRRGMPVTLTFSRTGQTTTVSGTTVVLTATGAVGPFRYLVLVNDTPTAGGGAGAPGPNPVIGWLDHGSAVTMANTDTYTIPSGAYFTIN
jgi:hypothetical protein